ncbi:MAG: Gfo/Idh/MocA family oxidoreductase [Pseudomonadales bacterium]|jgi:predicted dehydrogenase|nr:Gfo/Idh/MocA family oxidoreductase [Pseudomonadales bacterium]MDP7357099.1 Gfo/Idh/MocA family oxidoreductase [Pseudomonadales bacterium]MDP7594557.1 Gfo/Idh/MocA family oxidoreductase [Pseudomonadales bacterium]HJN53428.1 Gfo/Idh/MocA family oxidoreductase [Pseudomonadales bacterium]|tara:strand:- start:313 stop:1425 length:1113 start_codon:yes stop_codon:yes gene_type:complete
MSKPLKVGLVGTGSIARAHLPAFQQFPESVQLTAVCDIREEAAQRFAGQGLAKGASNIAVYTDLEKMLQQGDIDAVDICTTHDQHGQQVVAAAESGKHVLLEKPMGINMAECREMLAATDTAGITFMVAQCLRYLPHSQMLRQMIQDGEFGEIWALRSDNFAAMVPPRSKVPQSDSPRASTWYLDGKQAGGGALISQATHHIDLFRYYIGEVKRVTATSWTDHPLFINGAEESMAATMEFENGAVAQLLSSWSSRTPWNHHYWVLAELGSISSRYMPGSSAAEQYIGPVDVSLPKHDGERGAATFVPFDASASDLPTDQPFVNEILHFADCCRDGAEPISSGTDNLGTMKAVLGIYESAKTGKPVELAAI